MTTDAQSRSILVIAPDQAISEAIRQELATRPDLKVAREVSTLRGLNGRAVTLAAAHDIVVFEAHPEDDGDLSAIRDLVAGRQGATRFLALADDGISFAQLRALTEAGVDEVLPMSPRGSDLGAVIARAGITDAAAAPQRGRLFPVIRARGGVGASTLAVNLADQLAAKRGKRAPARRVALADLDLQYGTVGSMLDLPEQNSLMELAMKGGMPDAKFLDIAMKQLPSGLSVLTAPSSLGPIDTLSPAQIERLIEELRSRADYVVADLPQVMVPWLEPVLREADAILMVTDMTIPAIRHCRRQIDFLTADHPNLPIRIVLSHESRPMFQSAGQREASKVLERPLDIWLPQDTRAARAATDRGQPLSKVAKRSSLTKAIARLARTLSTDFPISEEPRI